MQNLKSRAQAEFEDGAAAIRAVLAGRAIQRGAGENQRGLWPASLPVGIDKVNYLEGIIRREARAIRIQAKDRAGSILARVKRRAEQQIAGQGQPGIRVSSVTVSVTGSERESMQDIEPLRRNPPGQYRA